MGERALAAWEIVSVVTTAFVAEWVVFSIGAGNNLLVAVPVALAFAYIFFSHRAWGESAREIGLGSDNFTRALRLLVAPMLLMSAVLLAVGGLGGSIDFAKWRGGGESILGLPVLGLVWGLVQQYVLQAFINRRAQVVWGTGARSILLVAFLFGALHLPNPWLSVVTFAGGLVWAWVYQRAPNLWALALSHSLMTWLLVSTVPPAALRGLRVGYKFFG